MICFGTGGVGKTTTAAAVGTFAAKMGRRVLILTIDPAQRLRQTLGLQGNQTTEILIEGIKGRLFGAVVDPQAVFDEFIGHVSDQPGVVEKMKKNHLYQQMTTQLSGSQDFSSLEKLYSASLSEDYDLIVLDTPPSHHAMEFLQAPRKLAALFNENISKWLRQDRDEKKGFFQNILATGTDQVLKALEKLTGSVFMSELSDFFRNIQSWQGALEKRIHEMHRLLVAPTTRFILVTTFEEDKMNEAQKFAKEIQRGGYNLRTVIINRAFPKGVSMDQVVVGDSPRAKIFRDFQSLAAEKEEIFKKVSSQLARSVDFIKLPELRENISDLKGVAELVEEMTQGSDL